MWFPFSKKSSDLQSIFPYRIHVNHPEARELFSQNLQVYLRRVCDQKSPLIILCIGTDRSTGDSLGPLVGSKLSISCPPQVKIYGTLENPVHAVNLEERLKEINSQFDRPPIIAVDACLGKSENIGYISIKPGPLQPGTGVNKSLPEVGDFHLIGVVNVGGFMEYLVLQNTRLSLVMKMAEVISDSLLKAFTEFYSPRRYWEQEKPLTSAFSE